ncbi:GNAT family N-acetyltransferase [Kytococcus sedentarius]|uniref:GNAT family N-acetyltransferase n=1 Tax=Kytococcus sedentarius TaxID=1276 RepID=UPI0035BBB041
MDTTLHTVDASGLDEALEALASFQVEGGPVHLHPGDLGWALRHGADLIADELRVWRRDGVIVALSWVDVDDLLPRMAVSPEVDGDREVAEQLVADLTDPAHGVLPEGGDTVEARSGTGFRALLAERGWEADEAWTPLHRSLAEPVEDCGLRIEVLDAGEPDEQVLRDRIAVQRAAFDNSTFDEEQWRTMAASPAYRRGRCLVGYDAQDNAVATATVWSAGEGRPGLIEPLGAHADFRGKGYGRAITVACAAELREMGASSVTVCTPSDNVGGVRAYVSAGFTALGESTDFRRPVG